MFFQIKKKKNTNVALRWSLFLRVNLLWTKFRIFLFYLLFKKGSRSEAANYRPVSSTSVPCKLLEHIIYHSSMIHLNSFDILVDAQHGFRPGHSCETQLINTVERLARSVNDRNQSGLLILDYSKAFDKVAHKRLLLKIEYYRGNGNVLKETFRRLAHNLLMLPLAGKLQSSFSHWLGLRNFQFFFF